MDKMTFDKIYINAVLHIIRMMQINNLTLRAERAYRTALYPTLVMTNRIIISYACC